MIPVSNTRKNYLSHIQVPYSSGSFYHRQLVFLLNHRAQEARIGTKQAKGLNA